MTETGLDGLVRWVAIVEPDSAVKQSFPIAVYQDAEGGFKATYGSEPGAMLVRPDGHLAWRGESWRDPGLGRQWKRTFVCNVHDSTRS